MKKTLLDTVKHMLRKTTLNAVAVSSVPAFGKSLLAIDTEDFLTDVVPTDEEPMRKAKVYLSGTYDKKLLHQLDVIRNSVERQYNTVIEFVIN